jgi:hypothetical protein
MKSTGDVGSMVKDGGVIGERGTAGILPISTRDGATCDECENSPFGSYILKKKIPRCPVRPGWQYGDICPWTCVAARVTTRLDSTRLGSAWCAMYAPRIIERLVERWMVVDWVMCG